MNLFHLSNYLFLFGSVFYGILNFVRGVILTSKSSQSNHEVALNVFFLLSSTYFVINSILYLIAFLKTAEYDIHHIRLNSTVSSDSEEQHRNEQRILPRFKSTILYLFTSEIGLAYLFNLIPSIGYCITALFPFFQDTENLHQYKALDKAELIIDSLNMLIFSLDSFLFVHLCVIDLRDSHPEPNISADKRIGSKSCLRPAAAYFLANIWNVLASWMYFAFNLWALGKRFAIDQEQNHLISIGAFLKNDINEKNWYFDRLREITTTQRRLFFTADCMYVTCAAILIYAAYTESKNVNTIFDSSSIKITNPTQNIELTERQKHLSCEIQPSHHHLGLSKFSQQTLPHIPIGTCVRISKSQIVTSPMNDFERFNTATTRPSSAGATPNGSKTPSKIMRISV